MNKTIFGTGIFFGVTAIILGAFGAHALKNLLDVEAAQTFDTGIKYQMYHALFLLILGVIQDIPARDKKMVFYLITFGVICFSFSIYLLATNTLTDFDFKSIGLITPLGGLLLIVGWLTLGYRFFKQLN